MEQIKLKCADPELRHEGLSEGGTNSSEGRSTMESSSADRKPPSGKSKRRRKRKTKQDSNAVVKPEDDTLKITLMSDESCSTDITGSSHSTINKKPEGVQNLDQEGSKSAENTEKKQASKKKWARIAKAAIAKMVETEVEEVKNRRSSSTDSVDSGHRGIVKRNSRNSLLEDIKQGNVDNWDPEACVTLLRFPTVTNYSGIKKLIAQASKEWLEDFLSLDGLGVLFETLALRGCNGAPSISDALLQLECVACIRAVMNNKVGLAHITNDKSYTRKLAMALTSVTVLVKQQVFELLAALSMYSEEGHFLAMDALNSYKVIHSCRFRFEFVIDELRTAEVKEYKTILLAFINCIVLGESSLPKRCALRNEFIGLGLNSILKGEETHESVKLQIQVFEENLYEDNESLWGSEEELLSLDHYEVFNALFAKVRDSPYSIKLLTVLQCLNKVNLEESKSDEVWLTFERIAMHSLENSFLANQAEPIWDQKNVSTSSVSTQTRNHRKSVQYSLSDSAMTNPNDSEVCSYCKCPDSEIHPPIDAPAEVDQGNDKFHPHIPSSDRIPPPPLPSIVIPTPPPLPGVGIPPPPPLPGVGIPPPPPLPGVGIPPPPPPLPSVGIPPPPPLPGVGIPPPPPLPGVGIPPPPPLPGVGIPPPPPLPGVCIPPPPPLPGVGIPPPPPPPPGGCIPLPPGGGIPPAPYVNTSSVCYAIGQASIPVLSHVFSSSIPKPDSKMKILNWNKVTSTQSLAENSVWKEIHGELTKLMPTDLNFKEIESLFCQRTVSKEVPEKNNKKSTKSSKVMLFDSKTSLNLNIFLRQYKVSPEQVASFVNQCDHVELGGDRLRSLSKVIPEDSEIEVVKVYSGSPEELADPEKFAFYLSKVASFRLRIEGMILMHEFPLATQNLKPQLEKLLAACVAILHHEGIKRFFAYVLTLGNFINMGSYAGNAPGFKLNATSKLWETRANQAGVTLLHYIVEKTSKDDCSILAFADDLFFTLESVKRVSLEWIKSEVQTLQNEVKKLKLKSETSDEEFRSHFSKFVSEAESELSRCNEQLKELEEVRLKLARYFCEEETKFALEEDCLKTFYNLCLKINEAKKENKDRKEREEKRLKRENERKRLEKEREELKATGVTLRGKKGIPPPRESEECLVDVLLNEIRSGNFKLRKRKQDNSEGRG